MSNLKKLTTINEAARKVLGISRDEYALCDYVQFRQADRRGRVGWCVDSKQEIADFIGITRVGLFKMIDRLCSFNLLYVDPASRALQVTEKWIDTANECKQSLHDDVNKVNTPRKQSLHGDVNKVTMNIAVKDDYKKEKGERKKEQIVTSYTRVTPPPTVENPFSVEADFALGYTGAAAQNGGPAVGPLPEALETEKPQTPASGPGMPPWGEYPKANTARELKDKLSAFYAKFDQEWQNTKEGTPAMKWSLDEIREVMWGFCEYAIAADWNWTYKQFNGRLRRWFKEQPLHEKQRRGYPATPAPVIAPAPVPAERFRYE